MVVEKKRHDYPRPIPFDEHQRRTQQDRNFKENRARRRWENTHGKTVHLYWADTDDDTKEGDCECVGETGSLRAGPPTYERHDAGLEASPRHQRGVEEVRQEGNSATLEPDTHCHQIVMEDTVCDCTPRFRTLKFPPKCNHVCARMGFECWMCHAK